MAVTIYDVAKHAGVGVGTVSRAINDSPNIRPETKEIVLKAVAELGFSPHAMAKRLATKRMGIVAAIMPFYTGHFYHELLRGIQQTLLKYENDLIIHNVEKPSRVLSFLDRTLQEKRCDGILAISVDIPDSYISKFVQATLPIIVVDRSHDQLDCVLVDNEQGGYLATRHLIELGHKRIAMISGARHSLPTQKRYQGYLRALAESHLQADDELFMTTDMLSGSPEMQMNDGFNEQAGWRAMEELLAKPNRPTAVFASSDIQALGVLKCAQEKGLKIPDELAIIGFDDIELSSYLSLTTMQQPMREMGRLAAETLMDKIENQSEEVRHVILRTRLVQRGSTVAL
ncbi:MAG: LacI family DNA-binding transcriptional regulator [Deferribacteres bacterium]|nr:LacI family DNA-binding transcriptional regulator [candidate division KSB1 bacterium]MCB9511408.1 LacI family DNA-binding transcriptional regulator [Deferribacteres bacterium]